MTALLTRLQRGAAGALRQPVFHIAFVLSPLARSDIAFPSNDAGGHIVDKAPVVAD